MTRWSCARVNFPSRAAGLVSSVVVTVVVVVVVVVVGMLLAGVMMAAAERGQPAHVASMRRLRQCPGVISDKR
jgi:cell division protein FtsN